MKQAKATARAKKDKPIVQVAALPWRLLHDGSPRFLLITSRETRRFVIPKGWPMKGKRNWRAAEIEAEEEAGVTGDITDKPIGQYRSWKRLRSAFVPVVVKVYALQVKAELETWREIGQRQRAWLDTTQAVALADEPGLATLIESFAAALGITIDLEGP